MNCLVNIDGFTSFYLALYVTKRVIDREQSIMGTIFFIFKVNTVEKVLKVLRDLFQSERNKDICISIHWRRLLVFHTLQLSILITVTSTTKLLVTVISQFQNCSCYFKWSKLLLDNLFFSPLLRKRMRRKQ